MAVSIALGVYVVAELVFSSIAAAAASALIAILIAWSWFTEPMRTRAEPQVSRKGEGRARGNCR